jgi:hypothetical protein
MMIDDNGNIVQRGPFWNSYDDGDISQQLISSGGHCRSTSTSTIAIRRELGKIAFPIPPLRDPDAFVYAILPLVTELIYVPEILASYRLHASNFNSPRDFTLKTLTFSVNGRERTSIAINQRLAEFGISERINPARNIRHVQAKLGIGLLEAAPRRKLVLQYVDWIKLLLRSTDVGAVYKLMSALIYACAIICPAQLRQAFLHCFYTPSRFKQRLLSLLKYLPLQQRMPDSYSTSQTQ